MDDFPQTTSLDFFEIAHLANQGVLFVGCKLGTSSSRWEGWQDKATSNKLQLLNWTKNGHSLVAVAKRGYSYVIDIDDLAACEALGFDREWLGWTYFVDTPSGGIHVHGLHDSITETLGNLINVYRIKGDKKSGKILELKLHNQSVAAPTAERFADGKKCAGTYRPQTPGRNLSRGIPTSLLDWIKEHGEAANVCDEAAEPQIDFHPDFEIADFLDHHDCSENKSGMVGGVWHVVVDSCPLCGKEARRSTLAAGISKFIFGGNSFGYLCYACGVNSRAEFEEKMQEINPDWESWSGYIYRDDDPKLLVSDPVFGAESADSAELASLPTRECSDERPTREAATEFTFKEQDTGNGERLVKKFGYMIRWISETNEWMVWGDNGWQKDSGGLLMRMTKAVLTDLIEEAYTGKEVDRLKYKHAQVSGSMPRRLAMIASAGFEHPVFTNIADWDADGWLFNCENGVIDLRTQTFRERTPQDLCLKQSPIHYDPEAKCPLWEAAMTKWMCGDKNLVEYVQVASGVTLTSYTGLQALFFNQGDGENGKDTAFNALSYVMGTYWQNANFMTFADTKNHSEHRNDLASLAGAVRMVTSCESSDGHMLDEGIIKQVTGCSPVTCRQIHGKPFTYMPQYKMWFMSNYEPVIKGNDWGIWRRVKKIPWNYTIKPEEKDPEFVKKLKAEAPGILNWMLKGLSRFIELGYKLPPCAAVEDATAQYRKDMDIIGRFADECLTFEAGASALGSSLYKKYDEWCRDNGTPAVNSRRFHSEFKKRYAGKITSRPVRQGLQYERVGILVEGHYPSKDDF